MVDEMGGTADGHREVAEGAAVGDLRPVVVVGEHADADVVELEGAEIMGSEEGDRQTQHSLWPC